MAKSITQEEANKLLQMKKFKVDDQEWSLPICGNKISKKYVGTNSAPTYITFMLKLLTYVSSLDTPRSLILFVSFQIYLLFPSNHLMLFLFPSQSISYV